VIPSQAPATAAAVMLVGGRGTRLGPLTHVVPKPLLPVGGRPFIEWPMRVLVEAGVRRFILAAGHGGGLVEGFARELRWDGVAVDVVVEPSALGTAGAIALAAESCHEADPVVVANGDSIVATDLSSIWRELDAGDAGLLVATRVSDCGRFGTVELDRGGHLAGFGGPHKGEGLVNAGIYLLRRRTLRAFQRARPLSLERDVLPRLLNEGAQIRVKVVSAPFIDIGVPESLKDAERFVLDLYQPRIAP
jgi:NDP-sugar pyrophosphorylase family protein